MFDFTEAMKDLVRHIAVNCDELAHIKTDSVIVSYAQARAPGSGGVNASLQPLRFKGGAVELKCRCSTYVMPKIMSNGHEILYILYFTLPRFLNLDFQIKLITIFHELYHIGPEFNGDIRRFPGRNYAHGSSRAKFNEIAQSLAESYIQKPGAMQKVWFLRYTFRELEKRCGGVVGVKVSPPKPMRFVEPSDVSAHGCSHKKTGGDSTCSSLWQFMSGGINPYEKPPSGHYASTSSEMKV